MRNRLQRLILLHDQYLQPVIRIIDVSGEFQSVTDRISGCCHRLAILAEVVEDPLGDTARQVQQEVTWLRRSIIQRAEEAKRELGTFVRSRCTGVPHCPRRQPSLGSHRTWAMG